MKKVLNTLFLLAALIFVNTACSQAVLGLRGGINMATMSENPFAHSALQVDETYMMGLDVALFGTFKVAGAFSVQPEFHWIQKGAKSTMTTSNDLDASMTLRYNYLELPVLARVDFGSEKFTFNVFAGPSVGYALDGKYIGKNIPFAGENPVSGDFEEELEWDTEYGSDGIKDNRIDINAVAGVGIEYDLGTFRVLLDGRYNWDFTDFVDYEVTPDPAPGQFFNRGIIFTAGIAVPF